jgi:hypothetical protein
VRSRGDLSPIDADGGCDGGDSLARGNAPVMLAPPFTDNVGRDWPRRSNAEDAEDATGAGEEDERDSTSSGASSCRRCT